jgi:hypothetical protein
MKKLQQLVTGRQWPGSRRRRALVAGIVAMALVVSGGLVAMAVTIPPANAGGLVEVGPISGENGFPVWYKDSSGVRLEACLDDADPFCGFLAGDVPDLSKPISFPDNFPAVSSRARPTASPTPSESTRRSPTTPARSASPRTSASPRAASPAR